MTISSVLCQFWGITNITFQQRFRLYTKAVQAELHACQRVQNFDPSPSYHLYEGNNMASTDNNGTTAIINHNIINARININNTLLNN